MIKVAEEDYENMACSGFNHGRTQLDIAFEVSNYPQSAPLLY